MAGIKIKGGLTLENLIISKQEYEILLNKKMKEEGLTKWEASQELKEELKIIKRNEVKK